jgi:hypothetical protein
MLVITCQTSRAHNAKEHNMNVERFGDFTETKYSYWGAPWQVWSDWEKNKFL